MNKIKSLFELNVQQEKVSVLFPLLRAANHFSVYVYGPFKVKISGELISYYNMHSAKWTKPSVKMIFK